MEYKISDKTQKITLGIAVIGFIFLLIGFFQQKDFVYAEKINDHSVEIIYNGHADSAAQNQLKQDIKHSLHGYDVEFHDAHHSSHGEHAHGEDHAHHGPTFLWDFGERHIPT